MFETSTSFANISECSTGPVESSFARILVEPRRFLTDWQITWSPCGYMSTSSSCPGSGRISLGEMGVRCNRKAALNSLVRHEGRKPFWPDTDVYVINAQLFWWTQNRIWQSQPWQVSSSYHSHRRWNSASDEISCAALWPDQPLNSPSHGYRTGRHHVRPSTAGKEHVKIF